MKFTWVMAPPRHAAWALGLAVLAGAPIQAWACTASVSTLAFGNIDPLDRMPTDSTARLQVTCPADTPFTATVSGGNGGVADRRMVSGQHALNYQVYADSARQQVVGDGASAGALLAGTGKPEGTNIDIHGRVPPQPTAVPGIYTDSLIITVSY